MMVIVIRSSSLARAASLAVLSLALACASAPPQCPTLAPTPASASSPAPVASAAPAASLGAAKASTTGYAGLGVESVAPELLARHAARPLPPDQSRRIQAMLDVRAPGPGIPSHDGKRLFFGWTVTGTPQLFRLDGPMSFPVQLTGGEDATTLVALSHDGTKLVVQRDRSGEENPGLYVLAPEGGALEAIQHAPKVQSVFDRLTSDGRGLYFHANDRQPDSYAVYRYDFAKREKTLVFAEPGIWFVADERRTKSGETLLFGKSVGSNMTEYYELEVATNRLTPLLGIGEREDYVARYGADDELLVLTPKLGEFRRLYRMKAGVLEPVTGERSFDVSSFSVDDAHKRILYTVNEGGYLRLFALDAKTQKPLALPKLPAADAVELGALSRDGKRATLRVDTGTAPPASYVVDLDARTATAWHKPAAPELDVSTFARVTLERYPARDGAAIPMFVRRPKGCDSRAASDGPCPVIVSFHGGPEAQAVAGFNTRAQLFVDAGFVYAEPNVRGSDGYGRSWLHADDGAKRLAVLTDIEDASR
ncbi:MAG: prolyl oligopeptidase family serine peptidase, partial [Deltaproteobacteria bacterium]|nr:prolyl oligopeptidase family serine peptidase [Deltaproteobacteria bacterium]